MHLQAGLGAVLGVVVWLIPAAAVPLSGNSSFSWTYSGVPTGPGNSGWTYKGHPTGVPLSTKTGLSWTFYSGIRPTTATVTYTSPTEASHLTAVVGTETSSSLLDSLAPYGVSETQSTVLTSAAIGTLTVTQLVTVTELVAVIEEVTVWITVTSSSLPGQEESTSREPAPSTTSAGHTTDSEQRGILSAYVGTYTPLPSGTAVEGYGTGVASPSSEPSGTADISSVTSNSVSPVACATYGGYVFSLPDDNNRDLACRVPSPVPANTHGASSGPPPPRSTKINLVLPRSTPGLSSPYESSITWPNITLTTAPGPVIATLSSVSTPTAGVAGSNVSATAIPEASCGGKGDRGPMILDFDDIPVGNSTGASIAGSRPVPSPYHRFFFSSGFRAVPRSASKYQPSSGSQLLYYSSFAPSAQIGLANFSTNLCLRFDFRDINLGCNATSVPCLFRISGLQWDGFRDVVKDTVTFVLPACGEASNCTLTQVSSGLNVARHSLTSLTAINITLEFTGERQTWWADDLQLAWTDNSCAAAMCRAKTSNDSMIPGMLGSVAARAKMFRHRAVRG